MTLHEFDICSATVEEMAAKHLRQRRDADLIPPGVSEKETPKVYKCLQDSLRKFFADQLSQENSHGSGRVA